MQNNLQGPKENQWLPGVGGGITKGNKVTFGHNGYIPGLDCSGDFKSVNICQNLSNCVL